MTSSLQKLLAEWKPKQQKPASLESSKTWSNPFQKVSATFHPDDKQLGSFLIELCDHGSSGNIDQLVGSKITGSAPSTASGTPLYVQFNEDNDELVWGLPGGNLIGRPWYATSADKNDPTSVYYALQQFPVTEVTDTTRFSFKTSTKDDPEMYNITMDGSTSPNGRTFTKYTLALDNLIKCNGDKPTLCLVPKDSEDTKDTRFVRGGLKFVVIEEDSDYGKNAEGGCPQKTPPWAWWIVGVSVLFLIIITCMAIMLGKTRQSDSVLRK